MSNKKLVIEMIGEPVGAANDEVFKLMVAHSDITGVKVDEVVGQTFHFTGYASCRVIPEGKDEFELTYYTTAEGIIISSGSEYFYESVSDYFEYHKPMCIQKIKCKKGSTYKAVPVMSSSSTDIDVEMLE